MKKLYASLLLVMFIMTGHSRLFAQWTTSGNNIYNSNTGYVGIGTTSPLYLFDVNGMGRISSTLYLPGGNGIYMGSGSIGRISSNAGGEIAINYNTGSTAQFAYYGGGTTTKFSVSNTGLGYFAGNVGIGTTSPDRLLTLYSQGTGSSTAQVRFGTFSNTITDQNVILFGKAAGTIASPLQITTGDVLGTLQTQGWKTSTGFINGASITFTASGSPSAYTPTDISFNTPTGTTMATAMTLKAGGNVGIGITDPASKLHIYSGISENTYLQIHNGNAGRTLRMGIPAGANYALIEDQAWDGTYQHIAMVPNGGNVGIGTTNPTLGKLQVIGTIVSSPSAGSGGQFVAYNPNNSNAALQLDWNSDIPRIRYGGTGAGSANGFQIQGSGNSVKLAITDAGNVGIGNSAPEVKLHVTGSILSDGPSNMLYLRNTYSSTISNASTTQRTIAFTTDNEAMRIIGNGNIGIGTTTPGGKLHIEGGNVWIGTKPSGWNDTYLLNVNGKVRANEIVVNTTGEYPDFVFDAGYKLMPLNELEQSIKSLGHLPNIPSAKEVAENGIPLGDMQTKLLQKVEELTLYVIELKKENEEMKKVIKTNNKK